MTQRDDDHEPVFKRSKWGTSRYVYNVNNPVGLALTVASLIVFVVFMVLIETKSGPFEPPPQPTPWSPPVDDNPTFDFGSDPTPSASDPASPTPSPSDLPSPSSTPPKPSPTFSLNDGMHTEEPGAE
ncbi:hypothetical protein [Streptomyces boluensis]|uniref:hypothetical protein n=1 Tax=Streptomyces boluensis TaxID=1775135 RepID=UPI00165228F1|nr:hypothetical protein [Streptomyces boluensis]